MMTIVSIINVLVTYLFQVNFYIGITIPINTVIIIILINDVDADDDEMMVMTMMMVLLIMKDFIEMSLWYWIASKIRKHQILLCGDPYHLYSSVYNPWAYTTSYWVIGKRLYPGELITGLKSVSRQAT